MIKTNLEIHDDGIRRHGAHASTTVLYYKYIQSVLFWFVNITPRKLAVPTSSENCQPVFLPNTESRRRKLCK